MDYPVPPDATNISVKMNETILDWAYNTKTYPTVIGDCPMINWTISPIPDYFIIKTHYEHFLPINLENGKHTFLYAMGTGRYLDTYAKQTTAYINVRMETDYTNLQVYTIGEGLNQTWIWNSANYAITKVGTTEIVTFTIKSQLFYPLVEDFLMEFTNEPHAKWDVNADGKTDMKDVGTAAQAFGSYPEHPRWNPMLDVTGQEYLVPDGKINMRDVSLIAKHYGETA